VKRALTLVFGVILFSLSIARTPLVLARMESAETPADKATARAELNQGVAAYRDARYEEAEDHLRKAIAADPGLTKAHLYLATTYTQDFIPGDGTAENIRFFELATEQYSMVLAQNPKQMEAIKGLAGLYLQMKKFDDAKLYYYKVLGLEPNDAGSYYAVGVIDWSQSFQPRMEERAKLGLKPDQPLNNREVCERLRAVNSANIAEGIDNLSRALALRPDYDDAMAYMNLMYREKADLECGDPAARAKDEKTADDWVDKTLAVKRVRAETAQTSTPPMGSPGREPGKRRSSPSPGTGPLTPPLSSVAPTAPSPSKQ
jgi:tetratricopeptide (TPR) repeat protein